MPTLLCVPILVVDEHAALADAAAAKDAGADLVELRIDELFTGSLDAHGNLDAREVQAILRLVAACPLPCIVTCRSAAESGGVGGYDGDDMARVALYERLGSAAAGEHPPRYIDVEYATYTRSANIRHKIDLAVDHPRQQRDVRTRLVLSMHDFDGRPRDLFRRVSLMSSEPAVGIVKVAYAARSIRDNLELFDLLSDARGQRPMIALGIGRFGLMSRVLAPKFNAFLTFASLRPAAATAPGQPTIRELLDRYRFQSITPRTRVYGLIGWPVEHSLSPLVHNAGFESLAPDDETPDLEPATFDAVYLPLPVPPEWEHFKATLAAFIDHPRLDFCGCSVTVPHKQHLVRFAREAIASGGDGVEWSIDDLSRVCGAANTLRIERDAGGRAVRAAVLNTDASAATACLRDALGDLGGRRIALIGAGGVARAIAAGLVRAGVAVVVCNRTPANAEQLVAALTAESGSGGAGVSIGELAAADLSALRGQRFDAVVNCTPVGMRGGPDPERSPVSVDDLRASSPGAVVFDTVYNPLQTPLLEQAALAGLRTVDGLGMFVRQAAEQFALWTGHPAPLQLFTRICADELASQDRA